MKQERLTRKVCSMYDDSFEYCCNKMADKFDGGELIRANQKLGQLEDIEDELGIDLVTLFKALNNGDGIYAKHPVTSKVCWIPLPELYYCSRKWIIGCSSTIFNEKEKSCDSWDCDTKDYGKTWALTEGELK